MTDDNSPWVGTSPRRQPQLPPRTPWVWLAVIAVVMGGLWLLSRAFPGRVASGDDRIQLLRLVVILVIVSAWLSRMRRGDWARTARYAAIWIGVFAVGLGAYAFRDSFGGVGDRLKSEFSGSYPVAASGDRRLVVAEADGGGFLVTGAVNGQAVQFLVDTGSTDTVLSPADAQRLGIDIGALSYSRHAETANGVGSGAPYTAERLEVGAIRIDNMPMVVNQAPLSVSLLGMSFLQRLRSYQVRGHRLYLTW